jgi:hypothetical protein
MRKYASSIFYAIVILAANYMIWFQPEYCTHWFKPEYVASRLMWDRITIVVVDAIWIVCGIFIAALNRECH